VSYDSVLDGLKAGKAGSGLPCADVRALLEQVGFHVKDGANGGHKVVTHPHVPDFTSTGYNCRGGNGEVSRNYLGLLIRVMRQHKDAIKRHLGEQ